MQGTLRLARQRNKHLELPAGLGKEHLILPMGWEGNTWDFLQARKAASGTSYRARKEILGAAFKAGKGNTADFRPGKGNA